MALSQKAKDHLKIAMAGENDAHANEIIAAIESGANPKAAHIAALGVTTNLSAAVVAAATITNSAGTYAIPGSPTGAEVDTAINSLRTKVVAVLDIKADNVDVETLRTEAEARLDAIEAKLDALLAALVAAGLML